MQHCYMEPGISVMEGIILIATNVICLFGFLWTWLMLRTIKDMLENSFAFGRVTAGDSCDCGHCKCSCHECPACTECNGACGCNCHDCEACTCGGSDGNGGQQKVRPRVSVSAYPPTTADQQHSEHSEAPPPEETQQTPAKGRPSATHFPPAPPPHPQTE